MSAAATKPKPKTIVVKVKKKGAPAYMVSFGDMMTLILCFFILLVSMAKDQDYGLMAKGIGSFVMSVRTMGLTGILDSSEKERIFDEMRRRFNLPPEPDPERLASHDEASAQELTRAELVEAMQPRPERTIAQVAVFEAGSATPLNASRAYLRELEDVLRPHSGEVLVLEGHALESGRPDALLAQQRAETVRDLLIHDHGFAADRIEVRTWFDEPDLQGKEVRSVDARLVLQPPR